MKRLLYLAILFALPVGIIRGQSYTPVAVAAYTSPSAGVWNPLTSGVAYGALDFTPPSIGLYCQTAVNQPWTPCTFSGGSSLPTATAAGQIPSYIAAGTTAQAINVSRVPVEFYGATPYTSEASAEAGPDDTAHFQSAVTAAVNGVATCQAGAWYHVEGPLNFASNEGLVGTSQQSYGGLCNLVTNSATTHVLSAVGTSGAYVTAVTLENLSIHRSTAGTGTSAGIYASFTGGMIVNNVLSYDSIYDIYRHASPGYGIGYWSHIQSGWVLGESSGTYYGFYDDSADGNAMNSIVANHSAVACQNLTGSAVSYGQILIGTAINDNVTNDFNTAGCTYGQVADFNGSSANGAQDIHWNDSIHDGFHTSAYLIENLPIASAASVEIKGGWVSGYQTTGNDIDIENSNGVSVTNVQISGQPDRAGIYAYGSSGLVLNDNNLFGLGAYPIWLNNTNDSTVTGNKLQFSSAIHPATFIQLNGSSSYNTITGNVLGGYGGTGIYLDSGTSYNIVTNNSIDPAHITTALTDYGTGNGLQGPLILAAGPVSVGDGGVAAGPNKTSMLHSTASNFGEVETWGANATTVPDFYISGFSSDLSKSEFYIHCVYTNSCTFVDPVVAPAVRPATLYSAAGTALPTCAVGIKGETAVVSDATSPTYMGAYTSGGGITTAVICSYNGTTYSWLTH